MPITINGTTGIDAGSLPVNNTGKISAGTGLPVILNTAGVDRVTVDTSGNVGVGVIDPDRKLEVYGSVPSIKISDSNAKSGVQGSIAKLEFAQHYGTITSSSIEGYQDGTATDYQKGGLKFLTNNGTTLNEAMRIDINGNVGIGVIPKSSVSSLEISSAGSGVCSQGAWNGLSSNAYYNGGWKYAGNGVSLGYEQNSGNHVWKNSVSGTAGNTITYVNAMVLDANGNLSLQSGTGALGYVTGAGGTVTQLTSKSTDVTLNKPSGTIIMNGAALAAGATVTFRFFNSVYTNSYDLIYFQLLNNSNADKYNIWAVNNGPGFAFIIHVKNISASSLSDILTINFALIKGAIA